MSLMEFLEIREGRLVPVYEGALVPTRCDWCEGGKASLLDLGSLRVCTECLEEAEREWSQTGGIQR